MEILTALLIIVTAFYAWANYRTMRVMEADVRLRTQPIPSIALTADSFNPAASDRLGFSHESDMISHSVNVQIQTSNAAMLLREVTLRITLNGNFEEQEYVSLFDSRLLRPISIGGVAILNHEFNLSIQCERIDYSIDVTYYDLAKNFRFQSSFDHSVLQYIISENDFVSSPFASVVSFFARFKQILDEMQRG